MYEKGQGDKKYTGRSDTIDIGTGTGTGTGTGGGERRAAYNVVYNVACLQGI